MLNSKNAEGIKTNLKNAAVSTFLLGNALVWYLTAFKLLHDAIPKSYSGEAFQLIIGLNFLAFIFSAFCASFLIDRFIQRKKWLKYWLVVGLLVSALFVLLIFSADFSILFLLGIIIGAYFGFGMPIAAGFFAACTEPKNRAKFGGALILLLGVAFPLLTEISALSTYLPPIVLISWLIISLIFLIYKGPESEAKPKNKISYRSIFQNRSFLLYLVPWLMFSLINDLTKTVTDNSFSALGFSDYVTFITIISGICAIAFGFIADKKGRKRLALVGFALLGIGYAALGLFPGSYSIAWFYIIANGIAWGAITLLFITTLWGDIAQDSHAEKYYLIGVLPYLFSYFTGDSMASFIAQSNIVSEQTIFSFAAFFLFMATLPLFYAPETLPEKVLKEMDLTSYIEKAKKKVGEKAKKSSKQEETTEEDENDNSTNEEDNSYEEAKKLAEKYY